MDVLYKVTIPWLKLFVYPLKLERDSIYNYYVVINLTTFIMYVLYICTYSVHEKRNEKGSTPVPRPLWQHFVHSMRKLYDYILQAAHWSLRFLDYVCIVRGYS